jgi:hypothetical protein
VEALREQRVRQPEDRLAAGPLWQDHNLVFASTVGTPLDDHNVRRQFRVITKAAGRGRANRPGARRSSAPLGLLVCAVVALSPVPGEGDEAANHVGGQPRSARDVPQRRILILGMP